MPDEGAILATGKHVIIIGGGDTGADCLGTSHRQKAASVHQFEIMPMPPEERSPSTPWPLWPLQLRIGKLARRRRQARVGRRHHAFYGRHARKRRRSFTAIRVGPPPKFEPMPGTEFTLDADLVLLAMGFTGPVRPGLIEQAGLKLDARGNLATENYQTSMPGVFAAGDARRGQSLVVWAIAEGRKAAEAVDKYLRG